MNLNSYRSEDFVKKIFCAYHPSEFLTNFCNKSECLMPLCPSCIHQHTQEHYQAGNKPLYINLHDALQYAKDSCHEKIKELENLYKQGEKMKNYREKAFQYLRKRLKDYKQQLYIKIEEQFAKYEAQILYQLKSYNEENVSLERQIQQKKGSLQKNISELYQKIGMLKGDQCLAALITYHSKQQDSISIISGEMKDLLEGNREKLDAQLNTAALNQEIKGIFGKIISIKETDKQKYHYESIQTPQKKYKESRKTTPKSRSRIFHDSGKKNRQTQNPDLLHRRSRFANSSYYDPY